MDDAPLLEGISSRTVDTPRLRTHILAGGAEDGVPVLFIHGNISSSRYFEETMITLPDRYRAIAPDLRGFGGSEAKPVDATRGLRDFSDDLYALTTALGLERGIHLVGWSMGGGVAMQYAMDHPGAVATLALISPLSPYGFGGTRDEQGTPCWPDYAGSGGGTASPEFVKRLAEGDRSADDPNSPRNVMNSFFFKDTSRITPEREEVFLSEVLRSKVGDDNYPGDATASQNWPNVAPGTRGVNNAMSLKYCNLSAFAGMNPKPDVLWVHGTDDQVISDTSFFDFGYLGQLEVVPGWPGTEVYPPQPMVSQIRSVLESYHHNGGSYQEEIISGCGHSPHVERPETLSQMLLDFLDEHE